jgi:hypothetical protein
MWMKSEVLFKLQAFILAHKSHGCVHMLKSNHGGEYIGDLTQEWLGRHRIQHVTAPTYSPEHNGVTEQFNCTIMNMVQSMLLDAELPNRFWAEALSTAMFIHNHVLSKLVNNQAPYKRLHGHMLDILKLQPFSCHAFILTLVQLCNKLQPHSQDAIYLGPLVKGTHHHLWVSASNTITESHNIVFRAAQPTTVSPLSILWIPKPKTTTAAKTAALPHAPEPTLDITHVEGDNDTFVEGVGGASPPNMPILKSNYSLLELGDQSGLGYNNLPLNNKAQPCSPERTNTPTNRHAALQHKPNHNSPSHSQEPTPTVHEGLLPPKQSVVATPSGTKRKGKAPKPTPATDMAAPRRLGRVPKPNTTYLNKDNWVVSNHHHQAIVTATPTLPVTIPNSYHEAIQSPNATHWIMAMQAKYNSIIQNKTYQLIYLPHSQRAINAHWLFKLKQLASGLSDREKAQWVIKGYSQVFGLNFSETYAPVVRLENLCLLLTITIALSLHVHAMDVKSAFLHAQLVKQIYIQQPKGFMSAKHPNKVCLLLKSLYSLKQAPHMWNQEIDLHLQQNSYLPTDTDPCVYVHHIGRAVTFISLYINNCTIITSESLLQATKDVLMAKFNMTNLSKASSILSIEVLHDHKHSSLSLHQVRHINTILMRYGLINCKPQYTLMTTSLSLVKLKATSRKHLQLPYCQAMGSLMYLSQATQPDISFAVAYLSKFVCRYNDSHWITVKHVI